MSPSADEQRFLVLEYEDLLAQYQLWAYRERLSTIRALAYNKWQAAGSPPGDGTEFWYAAEKELSSSNTKCDRPNKNDFGTPASVPERQPLIDT